MKKFLYALLITLLLTVPVLAEDYNDYDYNNTQVNIDVPLIQYDQTYDPRLPQTMRKEKINFENSSEVPSVVIAKYPVSQDMKNDLLYWHNEISVMISKDDAFDRYVWLFNENPIDYLAAYKAAQLAFEMARFGRSAQLAEQALEVNPKYRPAKKLYEKAKYRANM